MESPQSGFPDRLVLSTGQEAWRGVWSYVYGPGVIVVAFWSVATFGSVPKQILWPWAGSFTAMCLLIPLLVLLRLALYRIEFTFEPGSVSVKERCFRSQSFLLDREMQIMIRVPQCHEDGVPHLTAIAGKRRDFGGYLGMTQLRMVAGKLSEHLDMPIRECREEWWPPGQLKNQL